jgi:hypothetical protein
MSLVGLPTKAWKQTFVLVFFVRPLVGDRRMKRLRGFHSAIVSVFVLLVVIFVIKGVLNYFGIEGFQNPWENFMRSFQQAQQDRAAYDLWVGYAYRTSNKDATAKVLNDMKQRYFLNVCKFRPDWATPPQGMSIPNGAKDAITATAAYKTFVNCVQKGSNTCVGKLNDAIQRFMQPGCNFQYPFGSEPPSAAFN